MSLGIVLPCASGEKGVSIDVIGETLGHQSVLTTKAYVREFGAEVLDDAVEVLLW